MDGGKFYITRLDPGKITTYMKTLNAFVEKGVKQNTHVDENNVPIPDPDAPPSEVVEAGFELAHNFLQNQHAQTDALTRIADALEKLVLITLQGSH